MSYQVQSVLGPLDVRKLGRTLTHEHLSASCDQPGLFYTPAPAHINALPICDEEITLQNVGFVKQYPYSNKLNIKFNDDATHDAMMYEMQTFRKVGGGSIVENTSHGLKRNLALMLDISQQTGVNIVAGTGFYVQQTQSSGMLQSSVEDLCGIIRKDLTEGCEEMPAIKCGVIAEVGSGWPISAFERHAIQATATVQAETGCGVSFHPGRDPNAPGEIARIYLEAGGDKDKAVMSHLDRTIADKAQLLDFAQLGFYCQYDLFGLETSYYQLNPQVAMPSDAERIDRIKWLLEDGRKDKILMSHDVGTKHRLYDLFGVETSFYALNLKMDMPSDAQRIDRIKWLLDDGHKDKILMSHDIHTKHRLFIYGGHGFSHLLTNVAPQMLHKGISQDMVDHIMIDNPQQWMGVSQNFQPRITLN